MAYSTNEKSTGLDVLTSLAPSDLHIVGDVSDSGRAKAITQTNLEITIANSTNFVDELVGNSYFTTTLANDSNFINELTSNASFITSITNLSPAPLTTKGDLYTYSTAADRLAVGTNGQVLAADSTTATGLRWIDLATGGGGGTKLAIDTTAFSKAGTGETTAFTVEIPGGTLGTNDAIRFYVLGSSNGNTGNVTYRVKYGASTVATITDTSGTSSDYVLSGVVVADNSASAQISSAQFVKGGSVTQATDGVDSTESSSLPLDLVITVENADAGATTTAKGIIVEKITDGGTVKKVGVGEISDVEWFNIQYQFDAAGTDSMFTTNGTPHPSFVSFGTGDFINVNHAAYDYLLPDFDDATFGLQFDTTKQVIFQIQAVTGSVGVNDNLAGIGFCEFGATNLITDGQGTNEVGVGFVRKDSDGTWYIRTGNGAAFTETLVSISDDKHVFRCEFDPGHSTPQARFYVDGEIIGTITTTLPSSGAVIGFAAGNGSTGDLGIDVVSAPSFAVEI